MKSSLSISLASSFSVFSSKIIPRLPSTVCILYILSASYSCKWYGLFVQGTQTIFNSHFKLNFLSSFICSFVRWLSSSLLVFGDDQKNIKSCLCSTSKIIGTWNFFLSPSLCVCAAPTKAKYRNLIWYFSFSSVHHFTFCIMTVLKAQQLKKRGDVAGIDKRRLGGDVNDGVNERRWKCVWLNV